MPTEKSRKQLSDEVLRLKNQVSELRDKLSSADDSSGTQSIVGVRTLTLRYDEDSRDILQVNSPFAGYVRMEKEDLVGQPVKVLASVLGGEIFKEISEHDPDTLVPPRIADAANNVYEVLTTSHDGVVDVVMRDMTEAQQFKSYVQRYFGLDFESLSDEDKRSLSFPERRFITISFTDLRGFTKFTESNNPEEVRAAINAYFDEVIGAAEDNDVFPNQIVGDEVMVLYGAPKYHRDHPLRAIKTACEHIERVTSLRASYAKRGREIPHCGIGINSGDVIVGDMGSSKSDRKTYTALGTAVNLAARLCSAATAGQIILSEATLNAVLRILPDGWEHTEITDRSSSGIFDPAADKPQGKIEDVIDLPAPLRGKEILIGPGVATKDEPAEFTFRYLYQIKAKGISDALPVLTVERTKKDAMSSAALSDETESNEGGEMILGRYRLVAHIGKGGMGTVWRARDEFVNTVAIKMLNAGHGASESQVARFKREAKVMGKLAHRNICRIHEIGKAEGRIFIAMQYIDGVSLEQLISHQSIVTGTASVAGGKSRGSINTEGSDFSNIIDSVKSTEAGKKSQSNSMDGKVPDEAIEKVLEKTADIGLLTMTHQQALSIITKICDAVQFAHERGVLHRDLKPANIMIGRDGEPVVMDFGLAKLTRDRDDDDEEGEKSLSISIDGQVVGTIEYMAPEQALSSKDVNEQADVYSIGALFYHLLTGQKSFRSTGHILSDAKELQEHEPVPPRKIDKLIDPDLETIILKSLQPERSQRYRSVMQVRQDLEKYQNGEPISARKPTVRYRLKKKYNKYTVQFWLGLLALAAIVAFATFKINDYFNNFGNWKKVFEEDFTDGNINPAKFTALNSKGEEADTPWVNEGNSGVRLIKNQWLWFTDKSIRGDAKVEVKLRYEGEAEGIQICLNGDRRSVLSDWDYNPVGYACRYGIWDGTMAAITANQKAAKGDMNIHIPQKVPASKRFILTFERREGNLVLSVNNNEVHRESILIPLRGVVIAGENPEDQSLIHSLSDIGFRTWAEGLVIESIRIFRFTLPMEASPTVAGDALVEIDLNELAIEKYLTIAEDYPSQEPGEVALNKAFKLWYQTYLRKPDSKKGRVLRAKIDSAFKARGQDKAGKIVNQLEAFDLFASGRHTKSFDMFPGIFKADKNSRIALECLKVDHKTITDKAAAELLKWVAETRNVGGLNLNSLQLKSLEAFREAVPDLTALEIKDNKITSLDALKGKPLKALYCTQNQIASLEPLRGMKLDDLWCGYNKISDLGPVAGMTDLNNLEISNNKITDLAPLKGLSLNVLYCMDNQISDLSPLKGHSELSQLYCGSNPITDLTPLANLPIDTLDISFTNVTDITPLIGHKHLKSLSCYGCSIENLDRLGPDVVVSK